jgi:L-2-hydroxyglutarate oxidase
LPFEQCGKLLVATDALELKRMQALEMRCIQNSIEIHRIDGSALRAMEPNIVGVGALVVPATGITDYPRITAKMAELFIGIGGEWKSNVKVRSIKETGQTIRLQTGSVAIEASYMIACGGLMADRLAKLAGIDIDFQIVPFRGEYYRLSRKHNRIVGRLIYPIPDPALPFLGVHLTRMINGSVTVGPNAVLGFKREGYGAFNASWKDAMEMLTFPGFWRVIGANLASGLDEFKDAMFKPGYLKRVQKYCPQLRIDDLYPHPTGIRAQAVKHDGTLVHDFLFAESERSFHVCNAPSPAATSAIPIGEYICDRAAEKFRL